MNQTLAHFRQFSHFRHSFNYTVFPIHPFMQNKPNFENDKMNINFDMTSIYKILFRSPGQKNKPNSNPIKPKTNPIKANSKPIKANLSKGQKEEFLNHSTFSTNIKHSARL